MEAPDVAPFAIGVSLPHATFALVFNDKGVCIDAAPIAAWCIGKGQHRLARYWRERGAEFVRL